MRIDFLDTTISAFRDIDANQRVVIPKNQVCATIGVNKDDGGSNASGKTSFVLSPYVNMYGPKIFDIPASDLKNFHLKMPARIVNTYAIDGVPLIIDRTLGGKLQFKYGDNDWVTGGVEDVQSKINDILKITPEQLMALTYKGQEESDSFLLKKDAAKKDFLSSFFTGTDEFDSSKKIIDAELSELEKLQSALVGKQSANQSFLTSLQKTKQSQLANIASLDSEDSRQKIKYLLDRQDVLNQEQKEIMDLLENKEAIRSSGDYQKALQDHKVVSEKNTAEINSVSSNVKELEARVAYLKEIINSEPIVPQSMLTNVSKVTEAIRNAEAMLRQIDILTAQINQIRIESEKKKKEIDRVSSSPMKCTTCGQNVTDPEHAANHIARMQSDANIFNSKIAELEANRQSLNVTKQDIEALVLLNDQYKGEIVAFKANNSKETSKKELAQVQDQLRSQSRTVDYLKNDLKKSEDSLTLVEQMIFNRLKTQLNSKMLEKENISSQIKLFDHTLKVAKKELFNTEASISELLITMEEEEAKGVKYAIAQKINEAGSRILSKSGFFGHIFDGILEDLNREINVTLKMIPNVRQYSLQFVPDKLVASTGSLNKTITHSIKNGKNEINFKVLSGGEKLGLIIAVEEALETVLSRRLGVSCGWKFLDEQFKWIDENSKEPILDFYRSKSKNKTYLIVDHASEFNAAIESRITITKKNKIARIT